MNGSNKKRICNWVMGSSLIGIGILIGHVIPAICFISAGIYLMAREEKGRNFDGGCA